MAEVESIKPPASTKSIVIKMIIGLVLGIGIMLLPRPANLTPEGQRLLGLLVTVVFLWVSEAVPIGATALLSGAGLILLNIQSAQ
ncbi:MAG: anion permease, partial [Desulfamplus sp.]|nr:anion permease [Desulfamplus sp.]